MCIISAVSRAKQDGKMAISCDEVQSKQSWSEQEKVAMISGLSGIIIALISGWVTLRNQEIANEARGVVEKAVELVSSKGECRDGSELAQYYFESPIEVDGGPIKYPHLGSWRQKAARVGAG